MTRRGGAVRGLAFVLRIYIVIIIILLTLYKLLR